jgi:hypothetical protein
VLEYAVASIVKPLQAVHTTGDARAVASIVKPLQAVRTTGGARAIASIVKPLQAASYAQHILCFRPISLYSTLCLVRLHCHRPLGMSFYASVRTACTRPCVSYACVIRRPLGMSYTSVYTACTRPCVSYACVIHRPLGMSYTSIRTACTRPCVSYACIVIVLLVLEHSFVVRRRCLRGLKDLLYTHRQKKVPAFKGELILMSRGECKVCSTNACIDTRRIN